MQLAPNSMAPPNMGFATCQCPLCQRFATNMPKGGGGCNRKEKGPTKCQRFSSRKGKDPTIRQRSPFRKEKGVFASPTIRADALL
eukprot:1156160-Pelagomonas_calceolata.AAC.2